MTHIYRYGPLAGRILLAAIFVLSGVGKIPGFDGTVGHIAARGLPLPQLAAVATIAIELGGGLMLAVGWKARTAAAALFAFTALASLVFHPFWGMPSEQAELQRIMFLKNLAIMGGLLYVVVYGSGPIAASDDRE